MPAALPTILRRIQDQDDAPSLGAGQNGQALVWNNATGLFETAAIGGGGVSIDDGTTSLSSVWSSSKTDTEISAVDSDLTTHTSDATIHRAINDGGSGSTDLLSASQIDTRIGVINSSLSSHTGDLTIHRSINDASTAATVLWSASKINTDISTVSSSLTTHTSDATIHRTINDVGTGLTDLLSASEIDTRIAASPGSGDFLADGSVAMTGDFQLAGNEITSTNGDTEHNLGRAAVGTLTGFSNVAALAHRDHANNTSAAFWQGGSGAVVFNAHTGTTMFYRIGNSTIWQITSGGINFLAAAIASNDADTSYDFGRTTIGYDGTNTDRATFSHRDHATSTAAAFAQEADGDAIVNAPTGQTIQFKSNGADTVRINSAGRLGVGTTSIDALFHVEDGAAGAAALGSDVIALFESNANMGIQMSAPTNSNFTIRANTPAGSTTDLTLEYRSQFATLDIELGATYGYNAGQAIFGPRVDNIAALGSTSNRYTEVWAVDGTINTSDSDDKEDIVNASLGLDFINRLQPKEWKWKESKTIVDGKVKFKAKKDKRKHTGLIAQDVKAVLDALNIDTKDFAGFIVGEDGRLGLRCHEFMGPMIKAIQELSAKFEALEAA